MSGNLYKDYSKRSTFHFPIVVFWVAHQKRRGFSVKRVVRVWVSQQLRKEDFEHVDEIYIAFHEFIRSQDTTLQGGALTKHR